MRAARPPAAWDSEPGDRAWCAPAGRGRDDRGTAVGKMERRLVVMRSLRLRAPANVSLELTSARSDGGCSLRSLPPCYDSLAAQLQALGLSPTECPLGTQRDIPRIPNTARRRSWSSAHSRSAWP